jgi:hypothetical protein
MARTANIVWSVLGAVALLALGAAIIYGPGLYRKGRSVMGPVLELARSEGAIEALQEELPFAPPPGGLVDEERLLVFLEIRRMLVPQYERWSDTRRKVEREMGESWQGAKMILGVTRDVFRAQIDILRGKGMSPAEFLWLETRVYDEWHAEVERLLGKGAPEVSRRLRETTVEDLDVLEALQQRHGRTRGLQAMERHLRERLQRLEGEAQPRISSVLEANDRLFWEHHREIDALALDEHLTLHSRLRQLEGYTFSLDIGEDGRPRFPDGG